MSEQESHYTDDLKANFRSWELGESTEEKANELFHILLGRHPDEDPDKLNAAARDWVGVDE